MIKLYCRKCNIKYDTEVPLLACLFCGKDLNIDPKENHPYTLLVSLSKKERKLELIDSIDFWMVVIGFSIVILAMMSWMVIQC